MQLMIVILSDDDAERAVPALLEKGYRVTRVASTGGFLRRGNTTLLVGTEAEKVDGALQVLRDTCTEPTEEGRRRATVFVLDVARYEQL